VLEAQSFSQIKNEGGTPICQRGPCVWRTVVVPGTSTYEGLHTALKPILTSGVTLCTDGSGEMRAAAQWLPVTHVA